MFLFMCATILSRDFAQPCMCAITRSRVLRAAENGGTWLPILLWKNNAAKKCENYGSSSYTYKRLHCMRTAGALRKLCVQGNP